MHARPISAFVKYTDFIPLIDEEFDTLDVRQPLNHQLSDKLTTTWCNEYLWDDYLRTTD